MDEHDPGEVEEAFRHLWRVGPVGEDWAAQAALFTEDAVYIDLYYGRRTPAEFLTWCTGWSGHGGLRQRPCQTGGRFSANARGPSLASSVANTRSVWRASLSNASSRPSDIPSIADCLVANTASGAFSAMRRA